MGEQRAPRHLDFDIGRSLVYEDRDLLVVSKPAGLLTVDDDRGSPNLYSILQRYEIESGRKDPRLFLVHRLDRDTSGLLVFARTARVREVLQRCFEENAVERRYEAVVTDWNLPVNKTLRCPINLEQDSKGNIRVVPEGRGKPCLTYITCLYKGQSRSYLDISLVTGRRNQIRLTLKALGSPIVGDTKYGGVKNSRMMLNAYRLCFPEGIGLKRTEFEIERIFSRGFNI